MAHFCKAATLLGFNWCEYQEPLSLVEQSFIQHIADFGLSYGTKEEYKFRFEIYKKKDLENQVINNDPYNTFTVGHNQFSTWTDGEYKRILGYRGPQSFPEGTVFAELNETNSYKSIDWRKKGAVNPVKNQGHCGSCWAFSATSAIESHHFLKTGKLLSLSEQQVVDCDKASHGCHGGWQSYAMKYVEEHAQELESEYPYTAKDGVCKESKKEGKVNVKGISNVKPDQELSLMDAIAKGPVSVTVEADKAVFQRYNGGVLNSPDCGTNLDHAITAVGYGSTKEGEEYYIVRNSWGSSWGDKGYINIKAEKSGKGICGIQQISVFPTTD